MSYEEELVSSEIKKERTRRLEQALESLKNINSLLRDIGISSSYLSQATESIAEFEKQIERELRTD